MAAQPPAPAAQPVPRRCRGAQAILAIRPDAANAADVSCEILRGAAAPVLGEIELAAVALNGCIGLTDDGYTITLNFAAFSLDQHCANFDLDREQVQTRPRPPGRTWVWPPGGRFSS